MNFWEELRVAYYDMVELKVSLGYNEGTTARHIFCLL